MSQQNEKTHYINEVKKILNLERDYMKILDDIIKSQPFLDGLKEMFGCMDMYKDILKLKYEGANLINTPAERLVAYYIYKYMHDNGLFESSNCYSSPICSDIAIELSDVILNVEVKTLGVNQNKEDLSYLPYQHNQITFINKPIFKTGEFLGYEIVANIDPYQNGKPVLTYVIEIVYDYKPKEANPSFKLFSEELNNGISTVNLFCIPNGKLSTLFDNNIVYNFKEYKYYDTEAKIDPYFIPKKINSRKYKAIKEINKNKKEAQKYLRKYFKFDSTWIDISKDMLGFIDTNRIGTNYHESKGYVWIVVAKGKGLNKYLQLEPVKMGSSGRINFKQLATRYDGDKNSWAGVIHYRID